MPRGAHLIPNKPGERRGGRQKGTPNKASADIKAMILGALQDVGGREYLAKRALDTPGPFLALVGKVLPMQLQDAAGEAITLHLVAAQRVSGEAPMLEEPRQQAAQTIDGEAINVLDQPPPTE